LHQVLFAWSNKIDDNQRKESGGDVEKMGAVEDGVEALQLDNPPVCPLIRPFETSHSYSFPSLIMRLSSLPHQALEGTVVWLLFFHFLITHSCLSSLCLCSCGTNYKPSSVFDGHLSRSLGPVGPRG